MKTRKLKRIISCFCATVIAVSCFSTSVAAEGDTTNAEVAFSLKYLDSLPKKGEQGFDEFLKLPNIEKMNEERVSTVKHKNGTNENITVREKTVYKEIWNEVDRIENKVDGKTTLEGNATDVDEKTTPKGDDTISNNANMSRQMKIAGEIYKWVAENIEYDYESIEENQNKETPFRKPQDALFVYQQRMGVCAGKSDLIALMMRMAKIPCAYISTANECKKDGHAYNAVYLEDNNANRTGWTLLDSTNGRLSIYDKNFIKENMIDINGESLFASSFDEKNNTCITDYENISQEVLSYLRDKNEETQLDKYNAYKDELTRIFNDLLKKHSKDLNEKNKKTLQNNINEINKEIKIKLDELNNQFKDVVVIKNFNIYLDCDENDNEDDRDRKDCLFEKAETSLSFYEAAQILEKDMQKGFYSDECLLEYRKMYFPSFYDNKSDFRAINENMVKDIVNIICNIYNCDYDNKIYDYRYEHKLKIDGVKYALVGEQGSSYVSLSGDYEKPATEVQIPSDIANLGMPFKIYGGIKSIYLKGDMTVDVSYSNLKEINTEESNKYTSKDGVLYNRQTNEIICIFDSMGTTSDGIEYYIELNHNKTEIDQINFYTGYENERKGLTIRIPKFLTQYNMPIRIFGDSIESIILEGNEIIDVSLARELKSIDVTNSKRYIKQLNNKLFDTVLNKEIELRENIQIIDSRLK